MLKTIKVNDYLVKQLEYFILCTNDDVKTFCEDNNWDIYEFIELIINE